MTKSVYVQYGCGMSPAEGWKNFDASPTLRFERLPLIGPLYTKNASPFPISVIYGDIVRGLPVRPGLCDGVYCSHVLEHLALDDFRRALRNTFDILRPGGLFRAVLPDLEFLASQYLRDPRAEAALEFMQASDLGVRSRRRGVMGAAARVLGNSAHLWMWDYKSFALELSRAGFVNVRRAAYGDSSDPTFASAESEHRWKDCLGVECARPS